MRFVPVRLCALVVLLALCGACQPAPQTGNNNAPVGPGRAREPRVIGARGGTLVYRVSAPPKTFNYLLAADEATNVVSFFLTGGRLVEFDHDRQAYVPALAESWQLTNDGRSVEVTLRDGLKFSDGRPLTADDVAFTLRALYDERTASPLYGEAMKVGGEPIEAVVADARRLRLVFPEQIAAPENYMSNLNVLPRHVLEGELGRGTLKDAYGVASDPKGIVTAGPFAVESSQPGERVTLGRNPHYWKRDGAGNQLPYLDSVVIEVVADWNNAMARLGQGALDVVDRIRPADFAALRNAQGPVRAYDLGDSLYADNFWFNQNPGARDGRPFVDPVKRAWFEDVRFRRAVSHAIDRESIATNTYQGLATPLYGFVTTGNRAWAASDLPRTEYSLERARALLREAGFTTRGANDAPELYDAKGNRVEFTVIVSAENELRSKSALVLQEDLARLGMKVNVAPVENTQLMNRLNQSYDYEAMLFGTSATEPDPSSYADMIRSSSASHWWNPKQPKPATEWEARLDDLIARQAHETNAEARRALFREVQQILAEQLPIIPIVTRHIAVAANARVGNHRASPLPPFSLWNAEELFIRR